MTISASAPLLLEEIEDNFHLSKASVSIPASDGTVASALESNVAASNPLAR